MRSRNGWRAGYAEMCTSGSEGGSEKPDLATDQGAWFLPYKTTTSVNTAAALVNKGKRVLVVDLDQQASATRYLDLDPEHSPNLYDVFTGAKPAQLAIRNTRFHIDVLASHVLLAAIEEALEPGDELKLSDVLTPLKPTYDFILIDTPARKSHACL